MHLPTVEGVFCKVLIKETICFCIYLTYSVQIDLSGLKIPGEMELSVLEYCCCVEKW